MPSSNRPISAAESTNGTRAIAGGALILLGLVVVAASYLPVGPMASRGNWSQQQAQEYQAASAQLHALSNKYANEAMSGNPHAMRAEVDEAKAHFDDLKTQLESAQNRPRLIAWLMRFGGALLAAIGAAMTYWQTTSTTARPR